MSVANDKGGRKRRGPDTEAELSRFGWAVAPHIGIARLTNTALQGRLLRKAEKGATSSREPLCATCASGYWPVHPSKLPSVRPSALSTMHVSIRLSVLFPSFCPSTHPSVVSTFSTLPHQHLSLPCQARCQSAHPLSLRGGGAGAPGWSNQDLPWDTQLENCSPSRSGPARCQPHTAGWRPSLTARGENLPTAESHPEERQRPGGTCRAWDPRCLKPGSPSVCSVTPLLASMCWSWACVTYGQKAA